uniref:EF-hand domain-containing protein n=1 Tax=Elphidium margaritaceum TaxID=933848 RepID=A0A7S0TFX5_9EUKA|mmetsp:Transcript_1040/g.2026  ORF Transcript_1040/g.2026 Transcript_1040/m.2026 type:complete len:746 (+) Transcript_1040:138-2375(+)
MLSTHEKKGKYTLAAAMKRKTKKRVKRNIMVAFFASVAIIACLVHTISIISNQMHNSAVNDLYSSPSRKLLQTEEDARRVLQMMTTISEEGEQKSREMDGYPPDLLDDEQRKNGGWVLYFLGMCYTFVAIALVCDEWFVPAIEIIVDRLEMSDDAAGATWMAAGGSAPELFTSLIGTMLAGSNVGFGTIVGSAVFNVLFVIGCCAIFTPGHLPLTWYPFARDCTYYIFSLIILALFYGVISPNVIQWWEALILLCLYGGYCIIMFKNQDLKAYVFAKFNNNRTAADSSSGDQAPTIAMTGDNNNNGNGNNDNGDTGDAANNSSKDSVTEQQTQLVGGGVSSMLPHQSGMHFHASLYKFLTKDSTVKEHMAVHVVAIIMGEVKETFEAIDTDGNGHIDREELKRVLLSLGEMVSEEDVSNCFNEIDTDGNGQISYEEFEKWYVASEMRITTDVRAVFQQFDDNDDGKIESEDLRHLLEAMNDDETEISDEEVKRAMAELGKKQMSDEISETEFVAWYVRSPYFARKQLQRQNTLTAVEEEEENGIDLSMPTSNLGRVMWLITAPVMFSLYYTLPDVQKQHKESYWPLTFSGSMLWLMFYSYLMVWWAQRVGAAWGVPDEVMGLTFLAAGTSVPDLLSSVIVAKMGKGDMAVSSSIGSNIFDILIGLPFPWLLYCATIGRDDGFIDVTSESLFLSVVILIVMLFIVLLVIKCNGWKLTHTLGYSMFALWVLFVIQDLVRSLCDSCNV